MTKANDKANNKPSKPKAKKNSRKTAAASNKTLMLSGYGNTADVVYEASGNDAVLTYDAITDRSHSIAGIAFAYADDPTAGELTVEVDGDVIFGMYITKGGAGFVNFPDWKRASPGQDMVITLIDGSQNKTLSILNHRID